MDQTIYSWRDRGITMDRIRRDSGFSMPVRHLHSEYEIYYLTEGERYYFIENQTYHVRKGGLVLVNRNQIHRTSQAGTGSHERILIVMSREVMEPFLAVTGEFALEPFFREHWGVVQLDREGQQLAEEILAEIAGEFQKKETGYRHVILSLLSCLLIRIARPMAKPAASLSAVPKHRKVDEAASYISAHYDQPLSLEALARHFFMNKCYLSRIFKEATGCTIVEYLNMCRVKQARQLLTTTDMKITEVAAAVGYENITYFERVFKSCTLTTPLKYRQLYREET